MARYCRESDPRPRNAREKKNSSEIRGQWLRRLLRKNIEIYRSNTPSVCRCVYRCSQLHRKTCAGTSTSWTEICENVRKEGGSVYPTTAFSVPATFGILAPCLLIRAEQPQPRWRTRYIPVSFCSERWKLLAGSYGRRQIGNLLHPTAILRAAARHVSPRPAALM